MKEKERKKERESESEGELDGNARQGKVLGKSWVFVGGLPFCSRAQKAFRVSLLGPLLMGHTRIL